MPRPSLKDQRSQEILDAYLTCVARFGLEGATQDRIAAEAQVKRPLLRHYLGNKEDMQAALVDHVVLGFDQATDAFAQFAQDLTTPEELVEMLFYDSEGFDPRLALAWQALAAAAADMPQSRTALLGSLDYFQNALRAILGRFAPCGDATEIRVVAQGLAALYMSIDAMTPLAPPAHWRQEMKHAALMLVERLEKS